MERHHIMYWSSKPVHWLRPVHVPTKPEKDKERNLSVATCCSPKPPTSSNRNTVWHGGWSFSSSYKFQVLSTSAEWLPSCEGSNNKNDPHYLRQWLIQEPYSHTAVIAQRCALLGTKSYQNACFMATKVILYAYYMQCIIAYPCSMKKMLVHWKRCQSDMFFITKPGTKHLMQLDSACMRV